MWTINYSMCVFSTNILSLDIKKLHIFLANTLPALISALHTMPTYFFVMPGQTTKHVTKISFSDISNNCRPLHKFIHCLVSVHDTRHDQTLSLLAVNNRLTYSYDYTIHERDGVKYHVSKNAKAVVEPSGARYNLTNLFNGDKLLGKVPCIMHSELATSIICRYRRYFRHTESYNCNKLHPLSWSSS